MVLKRKAVSTIASTKVPAASKVDAPAEEEEEVDLETQIVAAEVSSKVMKRPAAGAKQQAEEEEENMEVEEEISEEEKAKRREQEIVAERTKELKMMYMGDLKGIVTTAGLVTGKGKEEMIKAVLKHEAKGRAAAREQEAKIRSVVVVKKEELEGLSISQLGKLCDQKGIKCGRSKPERIQQLLVKWQEEDGVDKALAQRALEERHEELLDMDNATLHKLCNKAGLDPYVKEILVERISKQEFVTGRYSRAVVKKDDAPQSKKVDMVDALLASESTRKKERELKAKQEEEVAKKKKDFRAMSVEDLKKAVEKKGLEATKKEEMIEALFEASVEEDRAVARKSELKKMGTSALKELVVSNGLETGSVSSMVEAMLAHEAKRRKELRIFEAKVAEVVAQKKEQLDKKPLNALKEMCASKGLAVGGGKEDKVERLLEEAQHSGEIDKVISTMMRNARQDELASLEKSALLTICENLGVDPFVKGVMAERILSYEEECEEPVTKKARKSN